MIACIQFRHLNFKYDGYPNIFARTFRCMIKPYYSLFTIQARCHGGLPFPGAEFEVEKYGRSHSEG